MRGRKATLLLAVFALAFLVQANVAQLSSNQNSVTTQQGSYASSVSSLSDPPYSEFNVPLYANGFDATNTSWTRVGASPYCGAVDYPANYIYTTTDDAYIGAFTFEDVASYDGGKIYIDIYTYAKGAKDRFEVWLYNETAAAWLMAPMGFLAPDSTWGWVSTDDVSSALDTVARINAAKVYLIKQSSMVDDTVVVDAIRLRPEQQTFDSAPNKHLTGIAVTNPTNAYDANSSSYASFVYSSVSGTNKALELWNFTSPIQYPSLNTDPLPGISSVDFYMKYNASLNTAGNPNDKYRIVYYVDPSATPQVLTDWRIDNATYLYVNGLDTANPGWHRVGASPYLGSADSPANYIQSSVSIRPDGNGALTAWTGAYGDWDDPVPDGELTVVSTTANNAKESSTLQNYAAQPWTIAKVRVTIRARQTLGDEQVMMFLVIGGTTYNGTSLVTPGTTYNNYQIEWAINPATLSAWTWADITNLGAGVWSDQNGPTWAGEIRITQMYVDIVPSDTIGDFSFADVTGYQGGKVFIEIYARQVAYGLEDLDSLDVYVWSQSDSAYVRAQDTGNWVKPFINSTTNAFYWAMSVDVSSLLNSVSQINNAKIYLVHRPSGNAETMEIDAMRIKIHSPGYIENPTIITWSDRPEPNDGVWSWTDLNKIRFTVQTQADTTPDPGCTFWEFEAWVTAISPKAKIRVQNVIDTSLTPETPVTARPNLDTSLRDWGVTPAYTPVTIRPNLDGTFTQWGVYPAAPTTHYDKVDDPSFVPIEPGDYVRAGANNLKDSYQLQDPTAQPWSIGSVKVTIYAKAEVFGDDQIRIMLVIGGTTYNGTLNTVQLTTYIKYTSEWYFNPATLSAWTWSDINALQAGVWSQRVGAAFTPVRVTMLYVEIFQPHYDAVDEATQNGDTDYINASAPLSTELFELQNPSAQPWTIGAVRVTVYAKQTTGDERIYLGLGMPGYEPVFSSSGFIPSTVSYQKYSSDWGVNPFTGANWAWSDLAALRAGVWSYQVGPAYLGEIRVTQLYVEILGPMAKADIWVEGAVDFWGFTFTMKYNTTLLNGPGAVGLGLFTSSTPQWVDDIAGVFYFGFNMGFGAKVGRSGNVTCTRLSFVPATTGLTYWAFSGADMTTARAKSIPNKGYSGVFGNVLPPDAAVLSITPAATVAHKGYSRSVSVQVKNEGPSAATFDVTVYYYPGLAIGTQSVIGLASGTTTTRTFSWNTASAAYGVYTLFATASIIPYEVDTADNSKTALSTVTVTIAGDVNGDKIVDGLDFSLMGGAYRATPGSGNWNINCDINNDGIVDGLDFSVAGGNYRKGW